MKNSFELLNCELDWIDNNPQYYRDEAHMEQVKRNIVTRYKLTGMINRLSTTLDGVHLHGDIKFSQSRS